jgi:periplasmic divalent cation tolerance protein
MTDVRVVLASGPDLGTMRALCRALVEERLVACANLVDGATSVYRWEGTIEEAGECLAVLKTTESRLSALEARVLALHPYDVPELVVLPVSGGSGTYLDWVRDAVGGA